MSLYEYAVSKQLSDQHGQDAPFYALIMAAMRQADSVNVVALRAAFPETYAELDARYNAPGGVLPSEAVEVQR